MKNKELIYRILNIIINTSPRDRRNKLVYQLIIFFRRIFVFFYRFRYSKDIKGVEKYLFFVGYGRSGHSIIGSLLDAHPNMVISHETDFFIHLKRNLRIRIVEFFILLNSHFYAKSRYFKGGYDYYIKNYYQGKYEKLLVLGDKRGAGTTKIFIKNREVIDYFIKKTNKPVFFIHVIRNPLNNIATLFKKRENLLKTLDDIINEYFSYSLMILHLINENKYNIRTVYHEDFIEDPESVISSILKYIDIPIYDEHLKKCKEIVFKTSTFTANGIEWRQTQIDLIIENCIKNPLLSRYRNEIERYISLKQISII